MILFRKAQEQHVAEYQLLKEQLAALEQQQGQHKFTAVEKKYLNTQQREKMDTDLKKFINLVQNVVSNILIMYSSELIYFYSAKRA